MNVAQALPGTGPRIVVLVKQVPKVDDLVLGPDGRLVRHGIELELNPYCRRAVTKGVELAAALNGHCVVITLGPAEAEDALREAVACGADYGVLVTDDAFRGSDTYATARALVAAIQAIGGSELVLVGRNSVDADTGQVGPAVAESLGYGFLASVRSLDLQQGSFIAGCQQDDRWVDVKAELPLVISCAERLCEPAKVAPAPSARRAVTGAAPSAEAPQVDEGRILLRAKAAVASDPSLALALTQEHARSYPRSPLATEREAIAREADRKSVV